MTTLSPSHPWTGSVRREVLPNGLTLLVQRDDSAPAVAVVTHVRAGFFDEPDRWVGISHVLEHMFFKGTPRRGVGQIARETKAAGGYLNASTSYDRTSYFVVLPSSALPEAIDIQADALRHSAIDAGELARELQVIIQEANRKFDTPDAVAYETLHELMFDRHRIRRWRIGTAEQLAGYTRDDVNGYYRSRYVPGRTIVAVVGAVDEDETLALLRKTYEDWSPVDGAHDPSPAEPVREEVRARTLRGDVSRAELVLGWRTVEPLHEDSVALDLAAAVLSSGRGSWLYRTLREPGIVTGVSASNYAPSELGVFTIGADLDPSRLDDVLSGIAGAVARLSLLGPSEEDMQRARTLLQARWARQMESMEGRASALASSEALGRLELLDEEYERLGTVTADEVRTVAARYLTPGSVSGVAYLPEGEGADLDTMRLAGAFAVSPADDGTVARRGANGDDHVTPGTGPSHGVGAACAPACGRPARAAEDGRADDLARILRAARRPGTRGARRRRGPGDSRVGAGCRLHGCRGPGVCRGGARWHAGHQRGHRLVRPRHPGPEREHDPGRRAAAAGRPRTAAQRHCGRNRAAVAARGGAAGPRRHVPLSLPAGAGRGVR